jgi:hypothetical protein
MLDPSCLRKLIPAIALFSGVFLLCGDVDLTEELYPGDLYLSEFYPDDFSRPEVLQGTFPCYPATLVNGRFYLIGGVDANTPYVISDRRKHYIRSPESILFLPFLNFQDASAELAIRTDTPLVEGEYLAARRPPTQWILTPYLRGGVKRALPVEFELTPDMDLRRAFAAIVFHTDDFEKKIFWRALGDIQAGETVTIDLVTDPIPRGGEWKHNFILIFANDGEVPTQRRLEIGSSLAAICFRWVQDYTAFYKEQNPDQDLPVIPIFQAAMPIWVNEEFVEGEARVRAQVDEYGFLLNPEVVTATHKLMEKPAITMVNRWLFLPKLVGGESMEATVAIPLEFVPKELQENGK